MVELRETAAETRSGSVKERRCNAIDVMGIEHLAHAGDVVDFERMINRRLFWEMIKSILLRYSHELFGLWKEVRKGWHAVAGKSATSHKRGNIDQSACGSNNNAAPGDRGKSEPARSDRIPHQRCVGRVDDVLDVR